MHAKDPSAAAGEDIEIAPRLGGFDDPKGVSLARHFQIHGLVTRNLQENTAVRTSLVSLSGRMQKPRAEAARNQAAADEIEPVRLAAVCKFLQRIHECPFLRLAKLLFQDVDLAEAADVAYFVRELRAEKCADTFPSGLDADHARP